MTAIASKTPFRQCWAAVPIGAIPADGLMPCAALALARIQQIRKARSCGAYLFADPATGAIYVVSEESSPAQRMLIDRSAWLVGYYREPSLRRDAIPVLGLEELVGDIEAHLVAASPATPAPLMLEAPNAA